MRQATHLLVGPVVGLACLALAVLPTSAANASDQAELVGSLMAFHGSSAIVSVMSTHCYETTGLDPDYRVAAENWYLRNIGFLSLADRVIDRLGGAQPGQREAAETYAGSQIMSAYNQAPDAGRFCREFRERVESGALDINESLAEPLSRAQAIGAQ